MGPATPCPNPVDGAPVATISQPPLVWHRWLRSFSALSCRGPTWWDCLDGDDGGGVGDRLHHRRRCWAGVVTELPSKPIRYGYVNGIALAVLISQLLKLFGFSIESHGPLRNLWAVAGTIAATHAYR